MNNKIKIIASAMIVLAIILLIGIFVNYFSRRTISSVTPKPVNSHVSGDKDNSNLKSPKGNPVLKPKESGDSILKANTENTNIEVLDSGEHIISDAPTNVVTSEPVENSQENFMIDNNVSQSDNIEAIPTSRPRRPTKPKNNIDTDDTKEPVISSNIETSNEEKRQVLNELDSALQGLLDAVGKVPTVDEEKLDASLKGSEVSIP